MTEHRRFHSGRSAQGFWSVLITVVATFGALMVPSHIVGGNELVPLYPWYDALLTFFFFVDVVVRLRAREDVVGARGWLLLLSDIVAALPLDLVTGIPVFALCRLLKLFRVAQSLGQWRYHHLQRWNILRLVYFVYWIGLCVHWLACGWLALRGVPSGIDIWTGYLHSMYWVLSTLTTIGYSDNMPKSNPEIMYAGVVMIFGVATYGYVIGNVANILANIDPARSGYFEHMEKLSSFMNYRGIPTELQRRVRDYHTYVWEHRLGYDEATILSGLPPALMIEVSMFLKRDVIQHVPFFATASDELLQEIALSMNPVVYMPGDVVFRHGERGREMYFISRGQVEVIGKDGRQVAVLRKGDVFGEMALVLNKPRTATVRATGYCDLYRLQKAAFDDILARYPEFAAHVRLLTRQRRGASNANAS
jgi:hypothetical protein